MEEITIEELLKELALLTKLIIESESNKEKRSTRIIEWK